MFSPICLSSDLDRQIGGVSSIELAGIMDLDVEHRVTVKNQEGAIEMRNVLVRSVLMDIKVPGTEQPLFLMITSASRILPVGSNPSHSPARLEVIMRNNGCLVPGTLMSMRTDLTDTFLISVAPSWFLTLTLCSTSRSIIPASSMEDTHSVIAR